VYVRVCVEYDRPSTNFGGFVQRRGQPLHAWMVRAHVQTVRLCAYQWIYLQFAQKVVVVRNMCSPASCKVVGVGRVNLQPMNHAFFPLDSTSSIGKLAIADLSNARASLL
jgi:hypothetical protein